MERPVIKSYLELHNVYSQRKLLVENIKLLSDYKSHLYVSGAVFTEKRWCQSQLDNEVKKLRDLDYLIRRTNQSSMNFYPIHEVGR